MVNPKSVSSKKKLGVIAILKIPISLFPKDTVYSSHQKVARLIVVLCNLLRSCDYLMKLMETLSPRDYSSEIIARAKHGVTQKH